MNDERNEAGNGAEPAANPAAPDLAGYPSVEALVQGYRNSAQEAKRLRAEAERLAQQVELPRQVVPQRDRPQDVLAQFGIPAEPLESMIQERVERGIQQAFAPLARMNEGRQQVIARYPDYVKFEAEVAQYVNQDPERAQTYARMFNADPAGAMEYAMLKFSEEHRKTHPERREPRAEGAAHAAIPSSRQGDARQRGGDESARAVEEAFKRFQQEGTSAAAQAYAKARLRTVITDEFLNQ